jgi:hypothetical protein
MSPALRREGGGGGCPTSVRRRRRHRDETVEGKEGDATPDLFLKHSDATLVIYV